MSYSLSLKPKGEDSKAIAVIRGGQDNGKYVYLVKNNDETLEKGIDYEKLDKKMTELKIKARDKLKYLNEIAELLDNDTKAENLISTDKKLIELYKICDAEKNDATVLKLGFDSKFEITPNQDPNKSSRYYIAGMSECGKSYITRSIIENYHKLFKDRKVYVISKLKEDETLDNTKVPLNRTDIETFLDEPPTLDEYSHNKKGKKTGSLIVFDDFDNIKGKVGKAVQDFIDDVCQMGRHNNISCVLATHHLTNYAQSKVRLSECNYYIVFPQATATKKLSYMLETYGDLSANQVKEIKKMNSRWALISRVYPKYVITENEIRILTEDVN